MNRTPNYRKNFFTNRITSFEEVSPNELVKMMESEEKKSIKEIRISTPNLGDKKNPFGKLEIRISKPTLNI